jgi:hypothetical protein
LLPFAPSEKASRIDLPTYKFYNQFERLIVSGGATGAITPYNPASNFGEGVVGYFMAISSVSVEIVHVIARSEATKQSQSLNSFPKFL